MRPAPEGYFWAKSVKTAKWCIEKVENYNKRIAEIGIKRKWNIELIDIDHDAGDYAQYDGDYIKLLDWLEETGRNYSIRIHSQNVVGRMNMLAICHRNGWKVID